MFVDVYATKGGVRVEITSIGEGYDGDYDPNDKDDRRLLRFYVQRRNASGEWEDVEDGSFCTRIKETDSGIGSVAGRILDAVYEKVLEGASIKKDCEWLSWMSA